MAPSVTRKRRLPLYKHYRNPALCLRNELHREFWALVDNRRRVRINQGKVAKKRHLERTLVQRAMRAMSDEGRIRKIKVIDHVPQYEIADPDVWDKDNVNTHATGRRIVKWG